MKSDMMQRYLKNIVIDEVGIDGQNRLLNSKILVCGAGGLGSTVIANLSSMGIGQIGIVDNDTVQITNLNRQYLYQENSLNTYKVESAEKWIKNFNKNIKINKYRIRLNKNNYENIVYDYDLIIDCFDSVQSKFLLNEISVKTNKTLIHGGVTEFGGQVMTIIPNTHTCLRCVLNPDDIKEHPDSGTISPTVSTIASIQAMEAFKYLLNMGELLVNQLLDFNGLEMRFRKIRIQKNPNCPLCGNRNS